MGGGRRLLNGVKRRGKAKCKKSEKSLLYAKKVEQTKMFIEEKLWRIERCHESKK